MHGWQLRELRRNAGLTLREVARAAGTSETNLSAYERDAKRPNRRTTTRLVAVIEAGRDSEIHRRNLMTVPALAAALRRGLRQGWKTADLLRLVREMLSNSKFVPAESTDRQAFFAEPTTTGDRRWDTLLAGVVEDVALREHMAAPAWTQGPKLDTVWFVGSLPSLRAYAFANSPISLQVRGVLIDPADLESV